MFCLLYFFAIYKVSLYNARQIREAKQVFIPCDLIVILVWIVEDEDLVSGFYRCDLFVLSSNNASLHFGVDMGNNEPLV